MKSKPNYWIKLTENVSSDSARWVEVICTPESLESIENLEFAGGFRRFSIDIIDHDEREMIAGDRQALADFLTGVLA